MRKLAVYYNDIEAGILTEKHPGAGYTFQYKEEYLNSTMPPISVTLLKQSIAYTSEYLFPFFSNMVPEGANRRVICRSLRIDENDFFGILEAMADKDFIGAVNIRRINND
ncbi:MAG: phosphatidylinositol kinase [Bacteroides sp.]|nr:phosphatidylinositol kinase [Bacteroides sp.]